jgi:secernin
MTARPWSCDTFVALADASSDGAVLFGKNSDRPTGECQPLRFWPRRSGGGTLRLAYLEIADAERTWAHLGASPYWCWGHEIGLNEWGVAIGNEALFTRDLARNVAAARAGDPPPGGVLGMELVRLGLERATTAREALSLMTELLAAHGQWGSGVGGKSTVEGAYDNSYLIADPGEAWVLETSGPRWVARALRSGTYAISNQPTIRTRWDEASDDLAEHALEQGWWPEDAGRDLDFARAYADPGTPLQASHVRLQRSRQLLAEAPAGIGLAEAARVLRDHYEGTFLGGPYFTAALPDLLTLCMHDSPAGFTWGNTASSAVMRLHRSDGLAHLWWAAATPCTSVYVPVFPAAGRVPDALATPAAPDPVPRPEEVAPAEFDDGSYWWRFQRLLDTVKGGEQAWSFEAHRPVVRQTFDELERRWADELPGVERDAAGRLAAGDESGRERLAAFTERCVAEAWETCDRLTHELGPIAASR